MLFYVKMNIQVHAIVAMIMNCLAPHTDSASGFRIIVLSNLYATRSALNTCTCKHVTYVHVVLPLHISLLESWETELAKYRFVTGHSFDVARKLGVNNSRRLRLIQDVWLSVHDEKGLAIRRSGHVVVDLQLHPRRC